MVNLFETFQIQQKISNFPCNYSFATPNNHGLSIQHLIKSIKALIKMITLYMLNQLLKTAVQINSKALLQIS